MKRGGGLTKCGFPYSGTLVHKFVVHKVVYQYSCPNLIMNSLLSGQKIFVGESNIKFYQTSRISEKISIFAEVNLEDCSRHIKKLTLAMPSSTTCLLLTVKNTHYGIQ